MLLRIYFYCIGFVKLKITGHSPERFFNLCSNREIELREITIFEDGYTFLINRKEVEELDPLLEKTNTTIEVVEKYGLPYFLMRYRKRKLFLLGFFLCIGIVYSLSLFVWDIQVKGVKQYSKEEIIAYVEEKYLTLGTRKAKVDCSKIEEDLREHYDKVAWISCELKGTQLRIQIKETLKANEDVKISKPCDVVALKSGIVTNMITRNGTPLVKEGDAVKKGDVLISGMIYIYDDTNTLLESEAISAQGDIMAKTIYNYEDTFAMNYYEKNSTGREKVYYGLEVFKNLWIPYRPQNPYRFSDLLEEETKIKLGHTYYVPFSIHKFIRKEFEPVRKSYTKELAKKKAEERLVKFLNQLSEKGLEIIENNVKISIDDENCKAKGNVILIEPIGKIRQIHNSSKGAINESDSRRN